MLCFWYTLGMIKVLLFAEQCDQMARLYVNISPFTIKFCLTALRFKKWANPGLFFCLFSFFSNTILQKNCKLRQDSNSDLRSRTLGSMEVTDNSTELWWHPRQGRVILVFRLGMWTDGTASQYVLPPPRQLGNTRDRKKLAIKFEWKREREIARNKEVEMRGKVERAL